MKKLLKASISAFGILTASLVIGAAASHQGNILQYAGVISDLPTQHVVTPQYYAGVISDLPTQHVIYGGSDLA